MKHLDDFLKRNRELAEAATPPGKAWETHPTGMIPETMRGIGIMGSHNRTPYIGKNNAAFVSASRTSLPLALEMLEEAVKALREIANMGVKFSYDEFGESKMVSVEAKGIAKQGLAAMEEKARGTNG